MNIQSQTCPGKPLFHTIDKQWRSENVLTFTFLPENETDATTLIASLAPFIRDSYDPWHMNVFSNEAKLCHQMSRWDHEIRQVFSAEESKISSAEDDKMNCTDVPTERKGPHATSHLHIDIDMPVHSHFNSHNLNSDDDSISTFAPVGASSQSTMLTVFQPRVVHPHPMSSSCTPLQSHTINIDEGDDGSVSKLSDTASRISTMESNISLLSDQFKRVVHEFREESKKTSQEQASTQQMLNSILHLLQGNPIAGGFTPPSNQANHLQMADPGDLSEAAGQGSKAGESWPWWSSTPGASQGTMQGSG